MSFQLSDEEVAVIRGVVVSTLESFFLGVLAHPDTPPLVREHVTHLHTVLTALPTESDGVALTSTEHPNNQDIDEDADIDPGSTEIFEIDLEEEPDEEDAPTASEADESPAMTIAECDAERAAASTDQVDGLTTDQIETVASTEIGSLSTDEVGTLTTDQIDGLTTDQVGSLTTDAVASLTTTEQPSLGV